jgi:hypothetical protein
MAHQWSRNVWKEAIDEGILFSEQAVIMYVVVKQQRKWAGVPYSINGMEDGMDPREAVV